MIDMSPSLALLILIAVLVGTGVTLMLERSLSRIVIGSCLVTYGINVLILMAGGRAGGPPILGHTETSEMSDPLPQAMVLTAIVISLALSAFMLAMSYRGWQLNGNDEVQDDREDRRIAQQAAAQEQSELAARLTDDSGESIEEQAEDIHDETEDIPVEEIENYVVAAKESAQSAAAAQNQPGGQQ